MKRFFIFFYSLFGIVFLIAGGIFLWHGLPRSRSVVCRRTENKTIDCRINSAVAGVDMHETVRKQLQAVEIYSVPIADADGGFLSFGVSLKFENETEILDGLTETSAQELKTKFENFINAPQNERLNVENSRRDWAQSSAGAAAVLLVLGITISGLKPKAKY